MFEYCLLEYPPSKLDCRKAHSLLKCSLNQPIWKRNLLILFYLLQQKIENQNCIGGWWRRLRVYSFFNKIQHLMDGQRYNRYMVKYNRNNLILFTLIENYVLWTRLYKNPINSRCVIICHPYDEPLLQVDRAQWPDWTSY